MTRPGAECAEQGHSLLDADLARGERPVSSARNMRVEITVRNVVDDTAGRAHYDNATHEHDEDATVGPAGGRQPQGPQRRPHEQPDAHGFVETHQATVQAQLLHKRSLLTALWITAHDT